MIINKKLQNIERTIDGLINRMHKAKSEGKYYKIHAYNDTLRALLAKWERINNGSIETNPVVYNKIMNKLIEGK